MPENRRGVVALCGAVSVVAATFAAILAPRPGALFFFCIFVAVVFLVILIAAGYPDFRDWLRPVLAARSSAGAAAPAAATQTVHRPAVATSTSPPQSTAAATAETGSQDVRAINRKTAEAFKKMSADARYSVSERMEFARKAGGLSPEIGAEAYKFIATVAYDQPKSGALQSRSRQAAAEKAGVLSPRIGAEAYLAIANDTQLRQVERTIAAGKAFALCPEIGAEATQAIADRPG